MTEQKEDMKKVAKKTATVTWVIILSIVVGIPLLFLASCAGCVGCVGVTAGVGQAINESKKDERVITYQEFNKIKDGMTLKQVQTIVGDSGTEDSSTSFGGTKMASYLFSNSDFSSATVMFHNGKVDSKMQFSLKD
jgi:hypothetical protein